MGHAESHQVEIATGKRFRFGRNWASFLRQLNEGRIVEAEKSLCEMLKCKDLKGKTFLDAGSGSGLFSLAARRLGATVHSFDFDPDSVGCTQELKKRFFAEDEQWTVEQGSVIDREYMKSLGQFGIVYSWGVLHHTGQMWNGLDIVRENVQQGGFLFIMIYLDRGWNSVMWRWIKRFYCSGLIGKIITMSVCFPYFLMRGILADLVRFKNPIKRYTEHYKKRGMSKFHDWIDWVGGYPYEVATPEEIDAFYSERGFVRRNIKKTQYVFEKM